VIVVDTNVIAYLFLPGIYTADACAVFKKDPEWTAPFLWRSEFRNVLALYLRKKHVSQVDALRMVDEAEKLMHKREYHVSSIRVLNFVTRSKCSAYDCEFVALADYLNIPLVTSDSEVIKAFPEIATHMKAFSG
jgi:predicted nucleic acid-binding protein